MFGAYHVPLPAHPMCGVLVQRDASSDQHEQLRAHLITPQEPAMHAECKSAAVSRGGEGGVKYEQSSKCRCSGSTSWENSSDRQ